MSAPPTLDEFIEGVRKRNPGENEFHQAVSEVADNVLDYIKDKKQYHEAEILRRIAEPDRIVIFRVCWEDDDGNYRVNRGYRVQNNNAIGPYKGGIRFHPSVTLSVLKFLAFEQTFKNSLTGLPMGGGKGGADFNPKGKSNHEVMRFCQAFMSELFRHIGPNTDVPAGDIGVGAREIGYMFGQYKRLTNVFSGILTGKGMEYGGSPIRTEATGYGTIYMMEDMLKVQNDGFANKTCLVSGSGNVAQYAVEKINQLGGKVVTMSDSAGFIYDKEGIDADKLAWVIDLKTVKRGPHRGLRQGVRRRVSRRRPAVEGAVRFGLPVRDPERDFHRRGQAVADERLRGGLGGRQHADRARRHSRLRRVRHLVRAVEGGKCRRRRGLGSRDEPELGADHLGGRGASAASAQDHAGHSRQLP